MDDANTHTSEPAEPYSQAARVIDKFGGIAPMSRALGHRNASTVQGWKKSGFIRPEHHDHILAAAKRLGIELTPSDFITVDPDHPFFQEGDVTPLEPQEA